MHRFLSSTGRINEGTITITFGDVAEPHIGMKKIGTLAEEGFTPKDLYEAKKIFDKCGFKSKLLDLRSLLDDTVKDQASEACVLLLRGGLKHLLSDIGCEYTAEDLYEEHSTLDWDKNMFLFGRVVNKRARHNLCYGDDSEDPDYKKGKGRVVRFSDVPILNLIRKALPKYLGDKASGLFAEGNYYYDIQKCGIKYHGDAERKIVVAFRLGCEFPLMYRWFKDDKPVGKPLKINLRDSDIYIMSEKATGNDWKDRTKLTLRHCAGSGKYASTK